MLQADYRFSDVQATYKIYKKRLYGDVSMTISAEKKKHKKKDLRPSPNILLNQLWQTVTLHVDFMFLIYSICVFHYWSF